MGIITPREVCEIITHKGQRHEGNLETHVNANRGPNQNREVNKKGNEIPLEIMSSQ